MSGLDEVTPLAGVWVEIVLNEAIEALIPVTPLAGVWVEITGVDVFGLLYHGHSPCGSVG